ncbi:gamma-butyrobetaine hydroxylase-like domain-containing protein [Aestuariirhabdus sp. LZHN29]|uniref:gamma-butyrobetaine hydroxylase-like domain-containing protein n=1 Tax=Aestuariirhabdus sp. LZHN29 TaxID=3417462 RepID=UPI003CF19365
MTHPANIPVDIKLHRKSRILELTYGDGSRFELSCEYLRVHSPSAEVRGHGEGQETLQTGKINVNLKELVPVGNYALKLVFDDGHDSGLYDWNYLRDLGENHDLHWQHYLDRLDQAGASRDPDLSVVKIMG